MIMMTVIMIDIIGHIDQFIVDQFTVDQFTKIDHIRREIDLVIEVDQHIRIHREVVDLIAGQPTGQLLDRACREAADLIAGHTRVPIDQAHREVMDLVTGHIRVPVDQVHREVMDLIVDQVHREVEVDLMDQVGVVDSKVNIQAPWRNWQTHRV